MKTMKAIIDRIEENTAVLALEDKKLLEIPVTLLRGVKEGDVLYIELSENGELNKYFIDREETDRRQKSASERLKKLFQNK